MGDFLYFCGLLENKPKSNGQFLPFAIHELLIIFELNKAAFLLTPVLGKFSYGGKLAGSQKYV